MSDEALGRIGVAEMILPELEGVLVDRTGDTVNLDLRAGIDTRVEEDQLIQGDSDTGGGPSAVSDAVGGQSHLGTGRALRTPLTIQYSWIEAVLLEVVLSVPIVNHWLSPAEASNLAGDSSVDN
jgi:hypothetical protein